MSDWYKEEMAVVLATVDPKQDEFILRGWMVGFTVVFGLAQIYGTLNGQIMTVFCLAVGVEAVGLVGLAQHSIVAMEMSESFRDRFILIERFWLCSTAAILTCMMVLCLTADEMTPTLQFSAWTYFAMALFYSYKPSIGVRMILSMT